MRVYQARRRCQQANGDLIASHAMCANLARAAATGELFVDKFSAILFIVHVDVNERSAIVITFSFCLMAGRFVYDVVLHAKSLAVLIVRIRKTYA